MTLTKIGNRNIELDHGLAPTPDGLDPFLDKKAIPIPGRPYGESYLHYIGPLAQYQTRIARARADEVLLNIWQQFVFREGAVRSSQFLFVPGGAMEIEQAEANRPIADNIMVLPRRPVFTEAYAEEANRQKQAEDVASADPVTQGTEATQKSRDVTATEVQQRILQGASRYQMENLYHEVSFKKPLLGKLFDLLRQNLTTPQSIRVLNKDLSVDLRNLDRPIDIVVGSGIMEHTKAEKIREVETSIQLSESPVFGPYMKPREVLIEMYRNNFDRKDPSRFVKTEEEYVKHQQEQAAAQTGVATGAPSPNQPETQEPKPPGGAGQGGSPGAGGLANAVGQSAPGVPADLDRWSKTCEEQALIGTELIELSEHYKTLQHDKAWQHFQGLLISLKTKLETGILRGMVEHGEDKTPQLRACYGIVLQILAIPAQVANRTLAKEYEANLREAESELEEDLTNYTELV
jgi:hypothetical protein